MACDKDHIEIVKLLLSQPNIDVNDGVSFNKLYLIFFK